MRSVFLQGCFAHHTRWPLIVFLCGGTVGSSQPSSSEDAAPGVTICPEYFSKEEKQSSFWSLCTCSCRAVCKVTAVRWLLLEVRPGIKSQLLNWLRSAYTRAVTVVNSCCCALRPFVLLVTEAAAGNCPLSEVTSLYWFLWCKSCSESLLFGSFVAACQKQPSATLASCLGQLCWARVPRIAPQCLNVIPLSCSGAATKKEVSLLFTCVMQLWFSKTMGIYVFLVWISLSCWSTLHLTYLKWTH